MKIVGCDFHPSYQQVAVFDTFTGEVEERKLMHADGQAEQFYQELEGPALIGIESVGNAQWFVRLVESLEPHQLWIGRCVAERSGLVTCVSRRPTSGTQLWPHLEAAAGKSFSPYLGPQPSSNVICGNCWLHRHKDWWVCGIAVEDRVAAPGA